MLKIDEIDICNVLKFSSINPSYLGVGYNGKIKISLIENKTFLRVLKNTINKDNKIITYLKKRLSDNNTNR